MTTYILCAQCGQSTPRRGDKRFCSTACRAQSHRDHALVAEEAVDDEPDEPDTPDLAAQPHALASPAARLPAPARRPADEWEPPLVPTLIKAALHDYRQQAIQEATQRVHQALLVRYERGVQTWLQLEGQLLSARAVGQHLREVDHLTASYRGHPAINQPGHAAYLRLQVLYKVGDALRSLQDELAEQANGFSFLGRATPTGALAFSKKRRQQLRESLLGQA